MFKSPRFLSSGFLALSLFTSGSAQSAEFELVGREMSRLLQNGHYARLPFNEDLSARFLERYLEALDGDRTYFLASEVADFRLRYERSLHDRLSTKTFMPIAEGLFAVYRSRISGRVSYVRQLLEMDGFDFSKNRGVVRDRSEEPWPASGLALQQVWRDLLEDMILTETIRRERLRARALEEGKLDPFREASSVKEKVMASFDRLLKTVQGTTEEDIANYFLSAVANAYDPHSEYYSENEMEQFKIDVSNELVGVGARLAMNDAGETEIQGIVNGGPADRHGELQLGDRVIAVSAENDGVWVDILFKPLEKVIEHILGQEDAAVGLRVRREVDGADQLLEIAIPRGVVVMKDDLATAKIYEYRVEKQGGSEQEMMIPDPLEILIEEDVDGGELVKVEEIKVEEIEKSEAESEPEPEEEASELKPEVVAPPVLKLGVITIPSFYFAYDNVGNRVSVDVERLIERLIEEGIDGLALDLRGNGGGSLSEVQRLTGFFVPRGPVVQVKSLNGQIRTLNSFHRKPLYAGPLVVLTDRGSASATEILAGALQDYHRGVIVGSATTYGKGTVQKVMDIADFMPIFSDRARAGALKLTFQKYYRVSGSSVQIKGVVPDLILPDLNDAYDVGEGFEKYALPHDVIRASSGVQAGERRDLHLSELRKKSSERVANGQYFKYLREDIRRAKALIARNELSLNHQSRLNQLKEDEERRHARTAERQERFAVVEKMDRETFQIYRLTLDDLQNDELQLLDLEDRSDEYIRQSVDEVADLEKTLKWPSGVDSVKREGLAVLRDLITARTPASVAVMVEEGPVRPEEQEGRVISE